MVCIIFFFAFFFSVVWFHNRVPLRPDIPGYYTVVRRIIYPTCIYTKSASAAVAAAAAAVREPDGIVAGSWNLVPSSVVFFLFIQTREIFNVCTRNPWQYCRIHGLDLPTHPR